MNLSFERATAADAETLVQVQIAAFHDDTRLYGVPLDGPPGYNSVEATLEKIREEAFYKIMLDGQVIGGIGLVVEPGHSHLDLLYVLPEYHSLGIGTRAMQFIEQAYPAAKWTLDTPLYATRNQQFYEKLGYVKTAENDYDGLILLAYEKRT